MSRIGLDELERMWNAQADNFNQWSELGLDEIIAFAQEVEREWCANRLIDAAELIEKGHGKRRVNQYDMHTATVLKTHALDIKLKRGRSE